MLTLERVHELLQYDQNTGNFSWIISPRFNAPAGSIAGSIDRLDGYCRIRIDRKSYKAHRLAWFWMTGRWPARLIDHINGNTSDNRFFNLREATPAQNQMNAGKHSHNTSGFKGVIWHAGTKKWRAVIKADGKQLSLGLFLTPKEAHAAYCAAAHKHHREFARTA